MPLLQTASDNTGGYRLALAATLALTLLLGIVFMPAFLYPGDAYAMRAEARALLTTGWLAVPTIETTGQQEGQYYVLNARDNRMYSKYGIGNSLAFIPPLAVEYLTQGSLPYQDRVLRLQLLNGYNVVLSLILAGLLFLTCRELKLSPFACASFVVSCLFCGFTWNYLRAQTVEIFQLVATAAAFFALLRVGRNATPVSIAALYAALMALCLLRFSFVLPVAVIALAAIILTRANKQLIALQAILIATIFLALGTINFLKFGSPFLSGYHVWRPDLHKPSLANLPDGLLGFLFNPQRSIFLHFPLLLIAAVVGLKFLKRYRLFYLSVLGAFAVSYISTSSLTSWRGENCYGPRYLLFILPQLALPAALALDWKPHWPKLLVYPLLAWSVWAQVQVNRLEFFAYYRVRSVFEINGLPTQRHWPKEITAAHFAMLNARIQDPSLPIDSTYGIDRYPQIQAALRRDLIPVLQKLRSYPNLYWWQNKQVPHERD